MASVHSTAAYKLVPGHPGYRVGDDGSVWSCMRRTNTHEGARWTPDGTWKKMKTCVDSSGRLGVRIAQKSRHVHRLVLLAFVGPCPDGMQACHGDGNPLNNRLSNLRWDTPKANQADRLKHGTACRGEHHPNARVTAEIVLAVRAECDTGARQVDVAAKYGLAKEHVYAIAKRKTWTWL